MPQTPSNDLRIYDFEADFAELDKMARYIANRQHRGVARVHGQGRNLDEYREECHSIALEGAWSYLKRGEPTCGNFLLNVMRWRINKVFTLRTGNYAHLQSKLIEESCSMDDSGGAIEGRCDPTPDFIEAEAVEWWIGKFHRIPWHREIVEGITQGKSMAEIAKEIGITRQAVQVHLTRMRELVIDRLGGEEAATRMSAIRHNPEGKRSRVYWRKQARVGKVRRSALRD